MGGSASPYGNVVLITGGNSGIGRATAEAFAARGFTVYAASRTPRPAVETFPGGGSIHPLVMDVTSDDSVVQAVATAVVAEAGPIGILVHSAGIGISGAAVDMPIEAAHEQLETNYFGVLRVNSAVIPGMMRAGRGLVVIVSSVAAFFPIPFQSHYASSKAALEVYGRSLAMEVASHGIRVALVQPGDTKTEFTAHRRSANVPSSPFYEVCETSVAKMKHDEETGRSPAVAARRIVALATSARPPSRNVVGADYQALLLASRLLPVRLIDRVLRGMYMKPRAGDVG